MAQTHCARSLLSGSAFQRLRRGREGTFEHRTPLLWGAALDRRRGRGDTKKEGGGGFWKKGALLVKGYGHPSTLVAVGFRCQDKFCSTCVKEGGKVFLRGTAENFTFHSFFAGNRPRISPKIELVEKKEKSEDRDLRPFIRVMSAHACIHIYTAMCVPLP